MHSCTAGRLREDKSPDEVVRDITDPEVERSVFRGGVIRKARAWKGAIPPISRPASRPVSTQIVVANETEDPETVHSTQKPVECMRRPLVNNSAPGAAVYDPFAGSFTTGIACEMTGRRCFAMELDPSYCDVAVLRWQRLTGRQAVLERDDRVFGDVAICRAVGTAPSAAVQSAPRDPTNKRTAVAATRSRRAQ